MTLKTGGPARSGENSGVSFRLHPFWAGHTYLNPKIRIRRFFLGPRRRSIELVFFIFGWGKRTLKERGRTLPTTCRICNTPVFYKLTEATDWFTLFFIPCIPYSTKHYLVCERCGNGFEVTSTKLKELQDLNRVTQVYLNGQMNEADYRGHVHGSERLD